MENQRLLLVVFYSNCPPDRGHLEFFEDHKKSSPSLEPATLLVAGAGLGIFRPLAAERDACVTATASDPAFRAEPDSAPRATEFDKSLGQAWGQLLSCMSDKLLIIRWIQARIDSTHHRQTKKDPAAVLFVWVKVNKHHRTWFTKSPG